MDNLRVPDATTVALVSVVVTGATAITTPLVTGGLESRREQRRFERERITKDFDEIRDLLDKIGVKIYTHTLEQVALEDDHSDPSLSPSPGAVGEADARREELYHLNTRLVIRLGREHPVTKAFGRCLRAIDDTLGRMKALAVAQEGFEVLADNQQQRWGSYWKAYEGYTDAAQQLVGARLGSVTSKR
jgi:hypothetical protein